MKNIFRLTCASIALSVATFRPAYAQEEQPDTSLDAVTVYATRSPQSAFDVPTIVSQVDADAPGNALARDVGDLLEFTPGVEVANGPRRNGQTISIRGFDDEAIITLVDGRRQNFESQHDGRFFIDPSLLKSVEVVKGASSAIYGGGGVGGVVAFDTKDAADLLAPGETSGAQTSFSYRSANNEYVPTATGYARSGGWDVLGSLTYLDSGDINQGGGRELDTEDRLFSGLFKLGYTFNDFHTVKLTYQGHNNDGQEPNNGSDVASASNPIVNKEVTDQQVGLKYAFENPENSWLSPKFHVYYNETDVEEEDITGVNAGRVQLREMETVGFTADNQTKFTINESHSHTFSYGFEIYKNEQTGSNTSIDGPRGGVPNAEATNHGFYLQDEIALDTSVGEFLVIPAARFDAYESDDENGNSQDESEVSPKFSVSYKPTDDVVFFGSWARAFRAPELTELYPSGQHFPGIPAVPPFFAGFPDNSFVPNPDLKPETVTTIEFGAGFTFDNIVANNDKARIKGAWFTSDGEDFITQEVNIFEGFTRNLNIPNARLIGFDIEGEYQLKPITAKAGLSFVEAEDDDTGQYLPNNVPLTFVLDVSYEMEDIDSVAGWRGRFAQKNDKVGFNDAPTDGYSVHDVYYRWTPDDKGLESLTFDAGVENVFDKPYARRFSTVLEEGRSFVARVTYRW